MHMMYNGAGNLRLIRTTGREVAGLVLGHKLLEEAIPSVKIARGTAATQDIGIAQVVNVFR